MGVKLFKNVLFFIVTAVVVVNVAAGAGLSFVGFPLLMQKVYFDQAVVIDDNEKVYVTMPCLRDWASKHSTIYSRKGKVSEAYRLQYEAYSCDTTAHWREMFKKE